MPCHLLIVSEFELLIFVPIFSLIHGNQYICMISRLHCQNVQLFMVSSSKGKKKKGKRKRIAIQYKRECRRKFDLFTEANMSDSSCTFSFGSPFCSSSNYLCFVFLHAKQVNASQICTAWSCSQKIGLCLCCLHTC